MSTVTTPSKKTFEVELERRVELSRERRLREIEHQAKGGKLWWVSFELIEGEYEIYTPLWVSGYGARGKIIVMAAVGHSQEEAEAHILGSFDPGEVELTWRFFEELSEDGSPFSARFQGPSTYQVWPGVPLQPMDEYLAELRADELERFEAERLLIDELKALPTEELVRRAVADYLIEEDEIEELTGSIIRQLTRTGRLAG